MKENNNISIDEENIMTSESRIKLNQSIESNIKEEKNLLNNLNQNNEEVEKEKKMDIKKEKEDIIDNKNEGNPKVDINYITEENLSLIKSKTAQLKQKYDFSIQYSDIICNFISYINELLFQQIDIYIIDNLNNVSFFNSLSNIYMDLIDKIKNNIKIENNFPNENINVFKVSIINIRNIIENEFSKKIECLQRDTKECNKQINEKNKRLEKIKQSILNKNYKIKEIRNELEKKYTEEYIKLFDSDIKKTNVIELPDLVRAIIDLNKLINLLIREINIFIENEKESLNSLNKLFNEINDNVRDIILSFIKENKNNFSNELQQKLVEIENIIEENNEKENLFSFSQILKDTSQRNKIYNILDNLSNLLDFSEENPFLIEKYENIESFFQFLIENNVKITFITIDDLIDKKMEVQYYPGFLRNWKNCFIYFTLQKHLIICDDNSINSLENVVQIFEMDKISFKLNSTFERPFIFEISPNYDVILKKYNTYSSDALSNKNLFELCLIFKDLLIKNKKKGK